MKYCTNCGTKLEEGAKFCHNCGEKVELPVNPTPIATSPPTSAHKPSPASTPAPAPARPQPQPQSNERVWQAAATPGEVELSSWESPWPKTQKADNASPEKKKKGRGCLRAIMIAIGILVLLYILTN